MSSKEEVLSEEICECGMKNVAEAIEIFEQTTLPYKKAKKLVTECDKSCCRAALMRLYEMVDFGQVDFDEIHDLIQLRLERIARLGGGN